MSFIRVCCTSVAALAALTCFAFDWRSDYENGLKATRAGQWSQARESFLLANKERPGDLSTPTALPGPPTERRQWRSGSPYSPRFLAAYAAYRIGLETTEDVARRSIFESAAAELQALVDEGQGSPEAFYFLDVLYGRLGDKDKRKALVSQYTSARSDGFKVDVEPIAPEEMALVRPSGGGAAMPLAGGGSAGTTTNITAGSPIPSVPGAVAPIDTKFALIVGNAEGGGLPFAVNDARRVRDCLQLHAGYPESNVVTLENASADQIKSAAEALAGRMTEQSTVLIYFTGRAVHSDGRDYLGGADKGDVIAAMLPKSDLFAPFVARGARVFSYFQVARPMENDGFFGKERPLTGAVSQMQATMPSGPVERTVREGQEVGVFTDAFCRVLSEIRSNQIPIMEFGWQVFYKVRRGDTGTTGGGSRQTPTLPLLSNLASDARF